MFISFLFYAFLIYLGYKLLFDLIIPLYKTTSKLKRGIREMQQKMQQQDQQQQPASSSTPYKQAEKPKAGDYIDFEEIK